MKHQHNSPYLTISFFVMLVEAEPKALSERVPLVLHLKMVASYYMLMRTIFSYSRELLHPLDEFQIKLSVLFLPWEVVHGSVPSLPKLLLKSYLFHRIACLQEIKGGVPILDREMTVKDFIHGVKMFHGLSF